ncbi:hypothetical protein ACHWQZ_G003930 [Mnemiopsis leidyi]
MRRLQLLASQHRRLAGDVIPKLEGLLVVRQNNSEERKYRALFCVQHTGDKDEGRQTELTLSVWHGVKG